MLLLAGTASWAQAPDADWKVLETARFRIHYPASWEAWTLRAAARIEDIRTRVELEVGYQTPQKIDVVVQDPEADSNGSAWPFLRWPRMLLWTNPPSPDSVIGQFRDWGELLVTHEQTHLSHLLRPSRNPLRRVLEQSVFPIGPLTAKSPRWVIEGYATVVEGRLTGSGRPNSALRASILRRWAGSGMLPSYAGMSSDGSSFLGMSMAYLMGSAYLEWLEARSGPGTLRHLWARMSARRDRSFDEAFHGVFGDQPETLYGRFRAELTAASLQQERDLGADRREGELWQRLHWSTGEPSLSPDGQQMVLVLRPKGQPSRMVIWSTAPDLQEQKEWQASIDEMLRQDPEDVAPILAQPLPRKAIQQLTTRNRAVPQSPRWMPGGQSVLYTRFEPDRRGFLHPDLFQWTPETGQVRRLTRLADVRDADPAPDGTWAAAVRNREGSSQLVRVRLADGQVDALTPPSVEILHDRPRIRPDGLALASSQHQAGVWKLVVRDLQSGTEHPMQTPRDAIVAQAAWSADGTALFAAVGLGSAIDLWRFDPGTGAGHPVTRVVGAAFAPAPTPDGQALFFLSLEPHGFDLRRLALDAKPLTSLPAPPEPSLPPAFALETPPPGQPYGLGRVEVLPLLGGQIAPSTHSTQLGLRAGDLIGRLDLLLNAALAPDGEGVRGVSLAAAWRRLPVDLGVQLYAARQTPSNQPRPVEGLGNRLDFEELGLELRADWKRRSRTWAWQSSLAGLLSEDAAVGVLDAAVSHSTTRGSLRFSQQLQTRLAGDTDGTTRLGLRFGLGLELGGLGLGAAWQGDRAEGADDDRDRFRVGGIPDSIVPRAAVSQQIQVPALPIGRLIGDRHESQRLELRLARLPVFYQRHRTWLDGEKPGDWLELVGTELRLDLEPFPLVRAPGLELRAGVARVFGQDADEQTHWWLSTVFRP